MPTFKLSRRFFNLQVKSDGGHDKQAAPSLTARSPSTHETTTAQQQPHGQEVRRTGSIKFKQSNGFLSLPGEVRNLIYSYAIFPSLETITIFHHADTFLTLPVFRVSRQVRQEAVSYLCTEHTVYLSGLNVANDFFSAVGENGLRSLRHVTVRSADTWHQDSSKASAIKSVFLGYMKLATDLRRFVFVVGQFPLSREDEVHLTSAHSSGAKFICAVKDVVNGIEGIGSKATSYNRVDWTGEGVDEGHRVERLGTEHDSDGVHRNVFRLYKANGIVGEVVELELPSCPSASSHLVEVGHVEAH
ncbi:hydrolase [Ascochyta rabiei]|uniref:Hydrolase n=2 Tax=Didymella rabiei TaxID=5454 RepID=A0A163B9S7_DIDRA|nr:hydrolase [Ascochyta rabiei]